jgi:hypothetical protein
MAIDENEIAVVKPHRPPPRGADDPGADIHRLARRFAKILDDHAALLFRGAWKDDYMGVDGKLSRFGVAVAASEFVGHASLPPVEFTRAQVIAPQGTRERFATTHIW